MNDNLDRLLQERLRRAAREISPEPLRSRIVATLNIEAEKSRSMVERPVAGTRWRPARWVWSGAAAAVLLAFLGGLFFQPSRASTSELVGEARRVHNLPLERCYVVEIRRDANRNDSPSELWPVARSVRIWSRGDRFWVEAPIADSDRRFAWGRDENGSLWAKLDDRRGVRILAEQTPPPLATLTDVCSLNIDALLGDVLQDCQLDETANESGSELTRIVHARPRSDRLRPWLRSMTLEIDVEAKALRRLTIERNRLGVPFATTTFTLVETRPSDDAKYRLEGHLTAPYRIHEGNVDLGVKLELLKLWLGGRNVQAIPEAGATVVAADSPAKADASSPEFIDVNGRKQSPLAQAGKKATLLFFVLPDCPISNAYAPEINRIVAEYEAKNVAAYLIYVDADMSLDAGRKHAKEYGYRCPALIDAAHVLVQRTGATVAPEVAVLGPDGKRLYRGRIDDLYADYGKRRTQPSKRDLREALDAILQGKPVPNETTKAIGCFISKQ